MLLIQFLRFFFRAFCVYVIIIGIVEFMCSSVLLDEEGVEGFGFFKAMLGLHGWVRLTTDQVVFLNGSSVFRGH